ncbi:MAG: molybdopterin cofactor-binding domain-containing protein [Rhodospirillales bacterium]
MAAAMNFDVSRRALLKSGGALVIGLGLSKPGLSQVLAGADRLLGKTLDPGELDGLFAVHADGSVTLFTGKVDLGQGLRVAYKQIVAEELGVSFERVSLVEGDTALTPDQGPTAGSTGIPRAGMHIRRAAATAREALIRIATEQLGLPADELEAVNGEVRPKAGGRGIGFGALIGDRRFALKVDPKAKLKDPDAYAVVGKPLARPDVPGKVTGTHMFVHDFKLPGMLHGRAIRPPAVGAKLVSVDESSIKHVPGARAVRVNGFLGVVAEDEWDAISAAKALKAVWSDSAPLVGHQRVRDWMLAGPFESDQKVVNKGNVDAALAAAPEKLEATFYWPLQTHGSMGPSCAVADLRDGALTVWTASQATHRFRGVYAKMLDLPPEKVRLIYLDGSGCYGMNGHDDAGADAILLSRATGRPVRVQWSRADEPGWDPKGPPQLLKMQGAVTPEGKIAAWRAEMWIPKATAGLPNVPLLAAVEAGIAQTPGISTGLISQNGDPPYAAENVEVLVHWLKDSPLRPSNIRAPGKIANSWAVESFIDDLALKAGKDPLEFRLSGLSNPRAIAVLKRAAELLGWKPRTAPGRTGRGQGIAFVHYKHNETLVAIGMEVDVDRNTGQVKVRKIACAHDCGQVINPDAVKQQVEGNILQTLSRTLFEEVAFDQARVTSLDWADYPILTFPDVPDMAVELIDRPKEPPLGAGEAATTPVPGALANAILDAVGVRVRTVPITPQRVKEALARGAA